MIPLRQLATLISLVAVVSSSSGCLTSLVIGGCVACVSGGGASLCAISDDGDGPPPAEARAEIPPD